MPQIPTYDILGIGNAIVDVLAPVPEAFLSRHDMHKGAMALIDAATAERLYTELRAQTDSKSVIESSGGSAANTCAVAALLGARVAYLGKVADDALGKVFSHDIGAVGVHFPTAPAAISDAGGGIATARCLIAVTADGQRTMNTFLGACVTFGPDDVDPALIADARVTYLEGYLFDQPAAQAAFYKAAAAAHAAGRQVALTLSDAFCVHRHRAAFRQLVAGHVDILFANEAEIAALYETNTHAEAANLARHDVALAAITMSENGSMIIKGGETVLVPAQPTNVVDTTGAGDAYAAGFLAAYANGLSIKQCATLGSIAAAEVISHYGARPQRVLSREIARL